MPSTQRPRLTDDQHHQNIKVHTDMGLSEIPCPWCDKKVQLRYMGVHFTNAHNMSRAQSDRALKSKSPDTLKQLTTFRNLAIEANASRSSLRARGLIDYKIKGKGKKSTEIVKVPVTNQTPTVHVHSDDIDSGTKEMLEDMAHTQQAVNTIQNAAVLLNFSMMLNQRGPEQMQAMLNGIANMGRLPAKRS